LPVLKKARTAAVSDSEDSCAGYGYLARRKPGPAAVSGSEDIVLATYAYLNRRKPSPRPAAVFGSEDSLPSYVCLD
jgi:hypothetical protein